LVDLGIPVKDL